MDVSTEPRHPGRRPAGVGITRTLTRPASTQADGSAEALRGRRSREVTPAAKLLLTPKEAAEVLSLGRTKIYQLIGDGTLGSVRIGKCRRVPTTALAELVEHLAGTGDPQADGVASPGKATPR